MVVSRGMRSPKREVLNIAVGDSSGIIILNYVFGSPLSQHLVVNDNLIPQVLRLRAFGIDYLGKPTFSKKRERSGKMCIVDVCNIMSRYVTQCNVM